MAYTYRSPWWVSQRWEVETIARVDSSSGKFKKGDRILIYSGGTKKKAEADAREWTAKTGQPTWVVPGAGHKTRRGF
jgi:hypothetical protein